MEPDREREWDRVKAGEGWRRGWEGYRRTYILEGETRSCVMRGDGTLIAVAGWSDLQGRDVQLVEDGAKASVKVGDDSEADCRQRERQ